MLQDINVAQAGLSQSTIVSDWARIQDSLAPVVELHAAAARNIAKSLAEAGVFAAIQDFQRMIEASHPALLAFSRSIAAQMAPTQEILASISKQFAALSVPLVRVELPAFAVVPLAPSDYVARLFEPPVVGIAADELEAVAAEPRNPGRREDVALHLYERLSSVLKPATPAEIQVLIVVVVLAVWFVSWQVALLFFLSKAVDIGNRAHNDLIRQGRKRSRKRRKHQRTGS
jgi:hypothetical protein